MAIDWGLGLNMPNPGNAFLQGLEQGRQRRIETETGNAFSSLMTNPDDTQALGVLARYRPQAAMHFQQQNAATAQAARESDIRVRAAQGDPQAIADLPGIDWNAWTKLDEGTRKQAKEAVEFIGQAALAIDRLPNEDERRQAWAEYVRIAGQRGIDVPPAYQQYSPAILQATLAEAQEMQTALTAREPQLRNVEFGESVYDVRPLSYGEAPRQVIRPYGKGSAPANDAPAVGTIKRGYRFMGGDPADQRNWQLASSGAPPVSEAPQPGNVMRREEYQMFVRSMGQAAADRYITSQGIRVEDY